MALTIDVDTIKYGHAGYGRSPGTLYAMHINLFYIDIQNV